jgi:hypothetical protein
LFLVVTTDVVVVDPSVILVSFDIKQFVKVFQVYEMMPDKIGYDDAKMRMKSHSVFLADEFAIVIPIAFDDTRVDERKSVVLGYQDVRAYPAKVGNDCVFRDKFAVCRQELFRDSRRCSVEKRVLAHYQYS